MYQAFKITTLDGKQITIGNSENLEINMGGVSLLNLADRTATYSNSFKIPRAANELIFSFAGNFSRLNKPIIPVVVSSGLFNKKANLKVLNANDSSYSCSVEYQDAVAKLNELKFESLFDNKVFLVTNNIADIITTMTNISARQTEPVYLYSTEGYIPYGTPLWDNQLTNSKSIFIKTSELLNNIETITGVSISGDILTDVDFLNSYTCLPNIYIKLISFIGGFYTYNFMLFPNTELKMSAADLLKQIALLWFCDITINGTDIVINKIDLTTGGIYTEINTFKDITKNIYSGLAKNNTVKYSISDTITDYSGLTDTVISDGDGNSSMLEMKLYIPEFDTVNYNLAKEKPIIDKIIIALPASYIVRTVNAGIISRNVSCYNFNFLPITGFYSSKLNPIFTNSQIIEASCWVDPFTANKIMTDRKIISQQLGGTYWVDTMAYSLTNHIAKLKLIKL